LILLLILLITILFFGIGNILTLLITVLYPAARSILALESGGTEDDKEWLTYWIIFGLFSLVDDFFGFILSYIPYFYWIKLALFAYLLLPQTRGASTIYNKFVKDFLEKNKDKISAFVSDVKNTGSKIASEA
jgi:receptor expression-enhancing protein 5/6